MATLLLAFAFVPGIANALSAEETLIHFYEANDAEIARYFQAVELITTMHKSNNRSIRSVRMHRGNGNVSVLLESGDVKLYPTHSSVLQDAPISHQVVFLDRLREKFPDVGFAFVAGGPGVGAVK